MALIVEDGSGVDGAEVYASIEFADAYFLKRNNTAWAVFTTPQKEGFLIQATDYLLAKFRLRWKGLRVNPVQALDWPRTGVVIESYSLPSNVLPIEVKNACVELAYRASMGPLIDDSNSGSGGTPGGAVIQETVGPITIKYAPPTDGAVTTKAASYYEQIELMLAPYLGGSSGAMMKLVRV